MNYSDFGNLEKGAHIPRWWLEQYIELPYDNKGYDLQCLNVASMIEKEIRKKRSEEVYVKINRGSIHILTDEEAAIESPRRHELSVRKLNRNIRKTHDIDVSNLTNVDKFNHQKNIMQFQVDMLRRSRKETGELLSNDSSGPPAWWLNK